MDYLPEPYASAMENIKVYSGENIYNAKAVNEVELAGYNVLGGLLEAFIPAILEPGNAPYRQKLNALLPDQFRTDSTNPYNQILAVVDYVSGMTDTYALELFRRIKGIDLPVFNA